MAIRIDHMQHAIFFNPASAVNLARIGSKLQAAVQCITRHERTTRREFAKRAISQNFVQGIEEDTRRIRERQEEMERRLQESCWRLAEKARIARGVEHRQVM